MEINEKLSAVFNISGFAIYIKINGMILVKNYVHNRLNLRLQVGTKIIQREMACYIVTLLALPVRIY